MSGASHPRDRLGIFDRLEQSIERLVEGPVGRVFQSRVQPAEIARRLERAMTVHQAVAVDGIIAPNAFHVRLNPDDLASMAGYRDSLEIEMEDWLVGIADERQIRFVGAVSVSIDADPSVPRRAIRVSAAMIEQAPLPDAEDEAPVPQARSSAPVRYELSLLGGRFGDRRIPLTEGNTVVGRAPACDVVLDDPSVSRFHARFEVRGRRIDLVDLGSTNGTRLNQEPVSQTPIEAGDEVSFGGVRARVTVEPARSGPFGGR